MVKIVINRRGNLELRDDESDDDGGGRWAIVPLRIELPFNVSTGSIFNVPGGGSAARAEMSGTLSGSITRLNDGSSFIRGGPGINVQSGSTGQITVSSQQVNWVWKEIPTGTIDGLNGTFMLTENPNPPESLFVIKNGLIMCEGSDSDYTLNSNVITFMPGAIPISGSTLFVRYSR